jgi:hypothetical protein
MLAGTLFAQLFAFGEKVQRMVNHIKVKNIFGSSLYLHDPRVAKFKNLLTIRANEVIVLLVLVGFLKLRHVLPKLVPYHESRFYQDLDIVVQSGAAYPVFFILHHQVKLLNIKMSLVRINFVQNGKTL